MFIGIVFESVNTFMMASLSIFKQEASLMNSYMVHYLTKIFPVLVFTLHMNAYNNSTVSNQNIIMHSTLIV